MSLGKAIKEEISWDTTENGAICKNTTGNACLDMFGRAGSMREADVAEVTDLFDAAFAEDADAAVKLLFYTRDIRGGYGERRTFHIMLRNLAFLSPESVTKNLWAILEFGRAKDLYMLIGTPCEDVMWEFMRKQFELDIANMAEEKSISLLAKWIATPDSHSEKTAALGMKTAQKLGYGFKSMRVYRKKLTALRKYLDIPEAKMCAGKWDEIEYSKCGSVFMLKNRKALQKHDPERYAEFFQKVENGEETVNTGALTPVDIIHQVIENVRQANPETFSLETLWKNLEDVCKSNVMVMADTSGSMTWSANSSIAPIEVALAMAFYFAERNKGDLKDLFITFESTPHFQQIKGFTLEDKIRNAMKASWGGSTNLEAAFRLLLKVAKDSGVSAKDLPQAIVVVSDMQINAVGVENNRLTFYESMKKEYEDAGYQMPQVIFWNVNAKNATFHASKSDNGVALVSGWSIRIFHQIMDNIGATPLELMQAVLNNERYQNITA